MLWVQIDEMLEAADKAKVEYENVKAVTIGILQQAMSHE